MGSQENMVGHGESPSEQVGPPLKPHEKFLELCALATSDNLTEEEQRSLGDHLAICAECREAMEQFETVVDRDIPALAPELARETPGDPSWSTEKAEFAFFERFSSEDGRTSKPSRDAGAPSSFAAVRERRVFHKTLDRLHLLLPLAAAALLCATLGILTYRMGIHRGVDVVRLEQRLPEVRLATENSTLEAVIRERDEANAQLGKQQQDVLNLRRQMVVQAAEIAKLKAVQSEELIAQQASEGEKQGVTEERNRLSQQLAAQEAALQASEKKLGTLEQQRSQEVIHAASLEAKLDDLSRTAKDREGTIEQQQELLAHDRDIRDLMGARDLYVAEVYDVTRTGETQKAFERVFYTKEKSLIFYAYDLDGTPGWRNAHAFQAWGTRGPDRAEAMNLGMFYEDNISKHRWVLKFTDKKTVEQIDAVFVTVEPHGGSEKPSGKPFLFAYLRMNSNHP
jgi:hypothetical protein